MDGSARSLVLGTAGHIDHGKTSLVKRLTGVDTDRLPEEKRRGITIDLGFASLDLPGVRLGIVDVPGHERFVHNMVAGATGVDLAMLVIAADDSVMPQTTEHLAILDLLGVQAGLVAITKADLVDADHLELVESDIRDAFAGTFLAAAPIVPVSSVTGQGLDLLTAELTKLAAAFEKPIGRGNFRLPIDRVFSVQGHGAVVTGTVHSGSAKVGATLALMPSETLVRARRLQNHQHEIDEIHAGQRAAINLAGVKADEIRRGDELCEPGYLAPARRLFVELSVLASAGQPVENRDEVRLHLATREVTARVIVKGSPISPGDKGVVELRAREPVMADYGQRFIVRRLSPAITIGGGRVLDPAIPPRRRLRDPVALAAKLAQADPRARFAGFLEENDLDAFAPLALARQLGIEPAERDALAERLAKDRLLLRLGGSQGPLIHKTRREQLGGQLLVILSRELKRRAPALSVERVALAALGQRLGAPAVVAGVIDYLIAQGKIVLVEDRLGLPGQGAALTRSQAKIQQALLDAIAEGGLSPPLVSELTERLGATAKEIERVARATVEEGKLARLGDGLYLSLAALDQARRLAVEVFASQPAASVAELRDRWNTTRKYAVPLCEKLDSLGVTVRSGDQRSMGPAANQPLVGPTTSPQNPHGP